MDVNTTTVAVIAKTPVAGSVKTRLCPPLTPFEAASVASELLALVVGVVESVALESVNITPAILLDGQPGSWIPDWFVVVAQRGGGLDERLANGFDDIAGPALIVAMDSPDVAPADIREAIAVLAEGKAVIGLTVDGGYWCIGLPQPCPAAVLGVPMSRSDTGASQLARLAGVGFDVHHLRILADVDTFDDLIATVRDNPQSPLARWVHATVGRS